MNISQLLAGSNANTASSASADVYAKVNKMMQAQNTEAPKINAALANDNTTLSGLGKLLNALSSFQAVSKSLSGGGLYTSASTTPGGIVSASTSSGTVAGSHTIQVKQLAQSQRLISTPLASPTATIGNTGNSSTSAIKIDFGTTTGNIFAQIGASKTVLVKNGDHSLQGIAAAINAAKIGVNATVAQSSAGYALVLNSPSGSASSLRIGSSGNPALQNLLTYNPTGIKKLSQTATAQDAALSINGTALSSPGNTVSSTALGVTLNLTATGTTTLLTTRDSAQLAKNVTNLIGTYNTLNASLSGLQQGDLKAGTSVSQIRSQLSSALYGNADSSASGAPLTLAAIGISSQKTGALSIDATKLQNAINNDPASIAKLFSNNGRGIADRLSSQIQNMVGSNGTIQKETTALNKDISMLNAKKSRLESTLTTKTNALLKFYSQQSAQGSNGGNSADSNRSLFDRLW